MYMYDCCHRPQLLVTLSLALTYNWSGEGIRGIRYTNLGSVDSLLVLFLPSSALPASNK